MDPIDTSSLLDVFTLVGMALVALKGMSLVKYALNRDVNGVVSTLSVWGLGIAVAFLFGASDLAKSIVISDTAITDMDSASKVILGIALGSLASVIYDRTKARDATGSAAEPKLLSGTPPE